MLTTQGVDARPLACYRCRNVDSDLANVLYVLLHEASGADGFCVTRLD
jgi:hypothetical protein